MSVHSINGVRPADLFPHAQGAALPIPSTNEESGKTFGQFLTEALGGVNSLQQQAGQIVQQFAIGDPLDVHQVMIALERASTALALTVQIRNKLVEAYQEIMRTSI
ncbi:MAG TPA: flagellar hook-basal body complex protein FliE [Chthonomonadales bacterium]|nr:flagellar hook-basal body complex protein FliE [Chthonomonadales bacterium]